jgi:hypothetical protein
MAWQRRRNQRYYYRPTIRNDRSVNEYMGRGVVAEIVAAHDETIRTERQAARDAVDSARQGLSSLDALMEEFEGGCDELTEAGLRSIGYYRCCRHWRGKRRVRALARAAQAAGGRGSPGNDPARPGW